MGDATSLIAEFDPTGYTVSRYTAGSWVNGNYIPGNLITFVAIISFQPLNGRDLLRLPEGERTRNYLKGYSAVELYTSRQGADSKADVVFYNGYYYEVQESQFWRGDFDHWKVTVAEINPS